MYCKILNLVLLTAVTFLSACGPAEVPAVSDSDTSSAVAEAPQVVPIAAAKEASPASPVGRRDAQEMVAAGFKRYGLEKGVLLFRVDGAMKGMDALYFDHWGWREGKHNMTDAEVGAYRKKDRSVQYLDGERRYQYEPDENTAYFFESRQVQAAADRYGTLDMTIVGDEMIKNMGGVPAGQAEVMGVTCDIWLIEKTRTTLYMWKGITMKEHSFTNNIPVTRRCVLLDTTGGIDLEKMILPEEAKLENVGLQ